MSEERSLEDIIASVGQVVPLTLSWHVLAAQGECDPPDSEDYRRVLQEWIEAGRPKQAVRFILARCKLPF